MKDTLQKVDEIPVTLVVLLAYVTMAFLTGIVDYDIEKLDQYGMLRPFQVAAGEWWRLFSAAFLHLGLLHLVMNGMSMISLGPELERSLGSVRFALLYLVSALGGHVAVCFVYGPFGAVAGGSGALFGMLGGAVAMQMHTGRHVMSFLEFEGPRRLLFTIVIYLVAGAFLPFISNTGHAGGLVAGFLVTYLFLVPPRAGARRLLAWRVAAALLLAGCTFYALRPVTRYEWLWNTSLTEPDAKRAERMRRAALVSYFGRSNISAADRWTWDVEVLRIEHEGDGPRPLEGR